MYERHKKPDVEIEEDKFDYKMTPALMRKLKSGIVSPMVAYGRHLRHLQRRRTKSTQGSGGTKTTTQTAAKKALKRGKK